MKTSSFLWMAGVTLAASVSWAANPEAAETTYTPYAEQGDLTLDLRALPEKTFTGTLAILYSSVGWEKLPVDAGETVTLTVTPDGGEEIVIAEGLTGCSTFAWTPGSVDYGKAYQFAHIVIKDGVTNPLGTLAGRTTFVEAGNIEPRQVFADGSAVCTIKNDSTNPWIPGATLADGILAPAGTSVFSFKPVYGGTLTFEYLLGAGAGTLSVYADGALVASLPAAGSWTQSPEIVLTGAGVHIIEVRGTDLSAGQASVKQAVWTETDEEATALAVSDICRVDLRDGVRSVRSAAEVLPIVYSATNFTGLAETAAPTVARVRLVQLTEDMEEIAGTEQTLVDEATDESSVAWAPKLGIWKLTFDIRTAGEVIRSEEAVFDARNLKRGLLLIFR